MKIKIEDKKILGMLAEKGELTKRNLEIIKQMEDLEKEFNTITGKVKRADERVRPLIVKMVKKLTLGEYDQLSRVAKEEGTEEWFIEIVDRMEEFKKRFKEKK